MSRSWVVRSAAGVVRSSEPGDWNRIYRIGRECDVWPRHATDDGVFSGTDVRLPMVFETLVVEGSGGVCGYIVWGVHGRGERAEVVSIAVDPAFRRVGYGTRLLWRVGSQSVVRGFRRVLVTVDECDDRAIAFFRSAGMRANGLVRGGFGDRDGIRFEVKLGGAK